MKRCPASILALFLFTVSAAVGQNTRSAVSLSGNDAATCTVPDPCRTFGAAIAKTNAGGEVVVLSTAGYGPFNINKSISIICPPAYHAAMAPTTGAAITVNAPGATVVLKNLYLNSLGGSAGVLVNSGTIVHIEGLVVNGFGNNGLEVSGLPGGTVELFVNDSTIRNNGNAGVWVSPNLGNAVVSIDHTRLERNWYGLFANSGVDLSVRDTVAARNLYIGFWFANNGGGPTLRATVINTTASDNTSGDAVTGAGFLADRGAHVAIRDSTASRNYSTGFRALEFMPETVMVLQNCLATNNDQGILAGAGGVGGAATIVVSNSTASYNASNGIVAGSSGKIVAFGNTVTKNGTGINGGAGTFESMGHNAVRDNTSDTAGTITPVPTM